MGQLEIVWPKKINSKTIFFFKTLFYEKRGILTEYIPC
jgi:hypothetical protein